MIEKEMGDRGSNLKEQRINDSWHIGYILRLRYILTDFERNYPVKNQTKQFISRRLYSCKKKPQLFKNGGTSSSEEPNLKLNPWWVTGLVDGEGSLMISIAIDHRSKTGWRVWGCISIGLHVKDHAILEAIQKFWGAGKIYKQGDNAVQIQFLSKQEFAKVIKHFNNFPLKTKKLADFQLFEIALDLIHKKEHLTVDGLKKL